MEHDPWKGRNYVNDDNALGQRVAIVGYSHYRNEGDHDAPDFTTCVIDKMLASGEAKDFLKGVTKYFKKACGGRITTDSDLWESVLFFNFIPQVIGSDEEKSKTGSRSQTLAGQARAKRLMAKYKPHKVLVFSKAAFNAFPSMIPMADGENDDMGRLLDNNDEFWWGRYEFDGEIVTAVGLRHTIGAKDEVMVSAVAAALDL